MHYPDSKSIYTLTGENSVRLPSVLAEAFESFIAQSGMPFTPAVTLEGGDAVFHFLFLSKDLGELVEEFLAVFEPDGFYSTETAVENDRVKHTLRIAQESGWKPFVRQIGAERTRICFLKTSGAVPAEELEERIELVG